MATIFIVQHFDSARWVKLDGIEFRRSAGVVYAMEHEMPLVGEIDTILIVNDNKVLFRVTCFSSVYFEHFRTFQLHSLQVQKTLTFEELVLTSPVHIRVSSSFPHKSIILPFYVSTVP